MKWNTAIQAHAQRWANRCVFEHSSAAVRTFNGGYHGQNLYVST